MMNNKGLNQVFSDSVNEPNEIETLIKRNRPHHVKDTENFYMCKVCGHIFATKYEGLCISCLKEINFCPICGARQDWSLI